MKRALVTGGAGFIGAHLVRSLLDLGFSVRVLDDLSSGRREVVPSSVDFIEGSVLDRDIVSAALEGADVCFHLAAVASVEACSERLVESHEVNITGWLVILDAVRNLARRPALVYASSAAVYGDNQDLPLSEASPPRPLSAYAADKLACEHHAIAAWRNYEVSSVGLRFFNVFGPGQDPASPYSGVISKFTKALAEKDEITFFGSGNQTRDFVYVQDIVSALILASEKNIKGADVFNVCTGIETSIRELAVLMSEVVNETPVFGYRSRRLGEVEHSRGDPTNAHQRLGHYAVTSLKDGLSILLATIKQD